MNVLPSLIHPRSRKHIVSKAVEPRARTRMSSIQDILQNEVESVRRNKRKCVEEVNKACNDIESLEEEQKIAQKKMQSLKAKLHDLWALEHQTQAELDFLEYRQKLISSPKQVVEIEPYPRCKRSCGYLSLLGDDLKFVHSVRSMKLELRLGPGESIENIQSLVQHVASNKELRRIELFYEQNKTPCNSLINLTDSFLNATASNGSIQDIVLHVHRTVQVLCSLKPTRCSSFTIHIRDLDTTYPHAADHNVMLSHLLTLPASTTQFCVFGEGHSYRRPRDLYFHWKSGNGGACTVRHRFMGASLTTVATSMQIMAQLETLELHNIDFCNREWDSLFPSLHMSSGLKNLSLIGCSYDEVATKGYKNLLQSNPSLCRAVVENTYCDNLDGFVWESILRNLPMGSKLQALSLTKLANKGNFLETLVSIGPSIPLSKLTLQRIEYGTQSDLLVNYIPQLTSIRELYMGFHITCPLMSVCSALLQNESLYHVEFLDKFTKHPNYSNLLKFVQARCERNQYLSSLLLLNPASTTALTSLLSIPFHQFLLPSAFRVAQKMKLTGLSRIYACLKLFCADMIGPHNNNNAETFAGGR